MSRPPRPDDAPSVPPAQTAGRQPEPVTVPDRELYIPYEPRYEVPKPEPRPKEVYREPRYQLMKPLHVTASDGTSPEHAAEEVLRSRAIHARHPHQFEPHEEETERSAYADFDMEDAVIKAAILNRPEY